MATATKRDDANSATPPVAPPPVTPPAKKTTKSNSASTSEKLPVRVAKSTPAPGKTVRDVITTAHATLAVAGIAHATDVSTPYPEIFAGVLVVSGTAWANDKSEAGFGAAVSASAGGWLLWSAYTTPWSVSSVAMLVISSTAIGTWYGKIWRRIRQRRKIQHQIDVQKSTSTEHTGTEQSQAGWAQILRTAGCEGVTVVSTTPLPNEASGVVIQGILTSPKFDYKALGGKLSAIELTADQHTSYPIRPGSIQLYREKNATAGQFTMSIPTKNVFGAPIPHTLSHEPRSIEDPIELFTAADGTRISIRHADSAHGMFSGMTDYGKSNILNGHIYEWTRCIDATVWLASGSDKSSSLFKPLLAAWLKGEIPNPPFDRFAASERETMYMMWDAKQGMASRLKSGGLEDLSSKWTVTPDKPRIMIAIEEAGDFLSSNTKWKMPDGKKWSFSELFLELIRKGRAAAVNLIYLVQGGTMDLTGDLGSAIKKQVVYRVAVHAQATTEVNACLATDTSRVELSELDKGEIYIEQAGYKRPVLALADYLEDGSDGNVMDIAARNHYQYARAVDAETAAAMPYYAERWTRPEQQEYLASLTGMSVETITTPDETVGTDDMGSDLDTDFGEDTEDTAAYAEKMQSFVDKYRAEVEADEKAREVEQLQEAFEATPRMIGDLDAETLRVVGVLQQSPESELTAADLRARVADALGMDDTSTETDRFVNDAVKDILGVQKEEEIPTEVKRRRPVGGSRVYVWNMRTIRETLRNMGR